MSRYKVGSWSNLQEINKQKKPKFSLCSASTYSFEIDESVMAYYNSNYSEANSGEYYQTPYYDTSHDYVSSQAFKPHSSYAYNDYNSNFQYDSVPCYGSYDPVISHSNVAYSSYTFSEPNYVEYALNPYGEEFDNVKTRFIVSYSVSEFNEPAFEEYDPTPYGGGYDADAAYGKPLPPSEGICYPRSSQDPNDQSLNTFSYGSIESPYGKVVDKPVEKKPSKGSKRVTFKDQEEQIKKSSEDVDVGSNDKPIGTNYQGEESKENVPDVVVQDNGSEYEKRVTQIPPGYGLEAMDLCESLFGYWPCLARAKRENDYRNCYGGCDKWSNENSPWEESTADYLFGNSYPYGERWGIGGIYENPIFNYEKHYQEQSVSRQVEYHEERSWLN